VRNCFIQLWDCRSDSRLRRSWTRKALWF